MTRTIALIAALMMAAPSLASVIVTEATIHLPKRQTGNLVATATLIASDNDRVTGGSSPIARMVHTHLSRRDAQGNMRTIDDIPLRKGVARRLSGAGYHIMLMGVGPLEAGKSVPVTVTFGRGEPQTINFRVVNR